MAKPSMSVPDELLDDFDDVIWELEKAGEIPRDTSRSAVLQQLMQEFVDEHRELLDESGKRNPAPSVLAD
jgi:metal-responsive CopG/Arc/MetJ family transcriptional regulator